MNALRYVEPRFTYGDYVLWQGDDRWELIDGEAFSMSPAPRPFHQEVAAELTAQFTVFLRGKSCRVYPAPFDVLLPDGNEPNDKIKNTVQPDLSVICDRKKIDKDGCRGTPDLIIEILSPSTSSRDQILKRDLYQRYGVREYWLLDPDAQVLTIYRLKGDGRFATPEVQAASGTTAVGILPGFAVDWSLVFAG
jgi:Uma2 family endonuclease